MNHSKKSRTKAQIQQEKSQNAERTAAEIDVLVAAHHRELRREEAESIGAVYARFSSRFQGSIADQVRSTLTEATRRRIFVPREHVFFDLAVRGYRDRRPGLTALRQTLASKNATVLLVFGTNRLYRKTYKALAFVEEEVVEQGGRCIFVSTQIDTSDGSRWRTFLNFHAMVDEMGAGMYADNVRAGQQGLFERGMVCGTLPVGYSGEDVPGEYTKRKKPRQKIVIEQAEADYVRRVFTWYVDDGTAISEIARRLNEAPDAPSPSRSQTGRWSHPTVRKLLMNTSYRGYWTYGKTEAKWQSKKDYARQIPRAEPLCSRQFEHLRIVPDALWHAAQARLATNQRRAGRKPRNGSRAERPRLLNGLLWCPTHNRALEVSGGYGQAMVCRDCRATDAKTRPLFTYLDRQLALQVVCSRIAEVLHADADLVDRIVVACQQQAEQLQQPDPARLQQLRAQEARITRGIEFAIQNLGDTPEDLALSQQLVRDLKQQRASLLADIRQIEAAQASPVCTPSTDEVHAFIGDLQQIFKVSADSPRPEEIDRVREILRCITGGRIELFQQGERRKHGGWLQGRFRCDLLGYSIQQLTGVVPVQDWSGSMMVVDFVPPEEENPELQQAWELYERGHLNTEIAVCLGCSKSKVTKLLHIAAEQRGVVLEDGRARRGRLKRDQEGLPLFQRIAEDVKRLADSGELFHFIATQLDCSHATVTKAWHFWHASRGLETPDGRTRRKSLQRKQACSMSMLLQA